MSHDLTGLLEHWKPGDATVADRLFLLVYDELRRMARQRLGNEPPSMTLEPTGLVHEVFLRLVDQTRVSYEGRAHFLAVAATMMRRVLVEHARARGRLKRGGDRERITLHDAIAPAPEIRELDVLALEEALTELAGLDAREAQVAELRIFAGLTIDEVAAAIGIAPRTVDEDWATAKAWLQRRLGSLQ